MAKRSISFLFVIIVLAVLAFAAYTIMDKNRFYSQKFNTLDEAIKEMPLELKVGQMFMIEITKPEDTLKSVETYNPGGIILFKKDIPDFETAKTMISKFQKDKKIPLFVAADEEGGIVSRLPFSLQTPGNGLFGSYYKKDPLNAIKDMEKTAEIIGKELIYTGINLDFAPDTDVNTNIKNPVIGIRAFSDIPEDTAKLAEAYIKGLNKAGVMSTIKHFPGHGDTGTDSHLELPMIDKLDEKHLIPFIKNIKNTDMVMVAHIVCKDLDDSVVKSEKDGKNINLPATLSKKIITDKLRKEIGYNGVVITDSFAMKAISDNFIPEESALMTVKAGTDIILMPESISKSYNRIIKAVKDKEISEERINQSVKRILELKIKYKLIKFENGKIIPGNLYDVSYSKKDINALNESNNQLMNNIVSKGINYKGYSLKKENKILIVYDSKKVYPEFNDILIKNKKVVIKNLFPEFILPDIKTTEYIKSADTIILIGSLNKIIEKDSKEGKYTEWLLETTKKENKNIICIQTYNPDEYINYTKYFDGEAKTYGYTNLHLRGLMDFIIMKGE